MGILPNNMRFPFPECYTTFWRMTIYSDILHWWDITPILTLYWSGPYYRIDFFTLLGEVSIEHLQRVRHANRGRLLLRTPGPVPFGICKCYFVETTDTQSYITPVYDTFPRLDFLPTLIFLLLNIGFYGASAAGVEADRGRLLLRTPGPVQLWDLHVF